MIRDDFSKCETDVRLDGKVALVTGATAGTGLEIAKNLAKRGAKVIIASRNPAKLDDARKTIIQSAGNENVVARQVDLESLTSVRNFVRETVAYEPRLNILINNIGAIGLEDRLTEDNLQLMMQVNYFGTFLLTYLLFPLMKLSAPSRIINVSSLALILGDINFEQMNEVGRYSNFGYYCNAKLADVLFTVEMEKRIRGTGVNVYSMDPGLGKSQFFRNYEDGFWKTFLNGALLNFGKPLHRVALMSVYLAVDPKVEYDSGKHYRDCDEFYSSWFANDTVLTRRLWEESKRLTRVSPEEDWENNGYPIKGCRRHWTTLNRIRTGVARCNYHLHKCGLKDSPACDCGAPVQTAYHVVAECPVRCFEGGLEELNELTPVAVDWIQSLSQNF